MINKGALIYFLSLIIVYYVSAQQKYSEVNAEVTFISAQHVYLKLGSTKDIKPEDTLYVKLKNKYVSTFRISYLSATSCAAINLTDRKFARNDKLALYFPAPKISESKTPIIAKELTNIVLTGDRNEPETSLKDNETEVSGRIGLSSYSTITSNKLVKNYQRWRYTLSLDADNLMTDDLSMETYLNFAYRADRWSIPGQDVWDKLKIYSLAFNYKLNDIYIITLGRKVNANLSSIGAVDGIQFESKFSFIEAGIVAGTRPDYTNYGISTDYLEFGAFISRSDTLFSRPLRNTISIFQISKSSRTDRRFLYFQHSNTFVPELYLFASGEIDIYKRENGVDKSAFDLTNFYLSGRYSPSSLFSLSASYDRRKNVMYYETFKSIADSLFDAETRQGLRGRINIKPFRYISVSLQYGTRSKLGDKRKSNNYGATLNYSRIPWINASSSLSFTRLVTAYVEGNMYGLTLNRFFFEGLLSANAGLRRVEYNYPNNSFALNQNIVQLDLGIRVFGRDYLSLSAETIMEQSYTNSRIYINFTKRF